MRGRRYVIAMSAMALVLVGALVTTLVMVAPSDRSKLVTAPNSDSEGSSGRDVLPPRSSLPKPTVTQRPTTHHPATAEAPAGRTAKLASTTTASTSKATPTPAPGGAERVACPSDVSDSGQYAQYQDQPKADFEARVEHAWLRCSDKSVLGTTEDGMEFRSGGRWSALQRQSDGTYVRVSGWGHEGFWEVVDDTLYGWLLLVYVDGSPGGPAAYPEFGTDLPMMRESPGWAPDFAYLQLPAGSVTGTVQAPTSQELDPAACTAPEGGQVPTASTQAAFEQQIAHAWQLCTQPGAAGAGIELRPDHTWSSLSVDAEGTWHRSSSMGTWESVDTGSMNGDNSPMRWQLSFDKAVADFVFFAVAVPKMRTLDDSTVLDYVQLPDGAVVG